MVVELGTLWAIICALIWWEAEKHSGFPRNIALKWALVCFFFGPFGVLFYIIIGRITGPSAEEYREQQALAPMTPATTAAARSPYQAPRPQRRRTSPGVLLLWIAVGIVAGLWLMLYLLQLLVLG